MLATPEAVAPKPDERSTVVDVGGHGNATVEKAPGADKVQPVDHLKSTLPPTSPLKGQGLVSSPSAYLKNTPLSSLKKRPRDDAVEPPSKKEKLAVGDAPVAALAPALALAPGAAAVVAVSPIEATEDDLSLSVATVVPGPTAPPASPEDDVDLEALGSAFPSFQRLFHPAAYVQSKHQHSSTVFPINAASPLPDGAGAPNVTFVSAVFQEGPLGLVFHPVAHRDDLFCIEDIVPDSQVEHKHMIRVGDLIAAVNDTVLHGLSFEEVYGLLKATPRPMVIRFTRGPGAIPPLPPPPRRVSPLPIPGDTRSGYVNYARYRNGKSDEARPLDRARVRSRNKTFLALHAGPFAKLVNASVGREHGGNHAASSLAAKAEKKAEKTIKALQASMAKTSFARTRLQTRIKHMLETQAQLKEKASDAVVKRRDAVSTAKLISQQNSLLRREINKKNKEGAEAAKQFEKMKTKNVSLRKQAQDAVIQRSILSTEVKKLGAELDVVKTEMHKTNVQTMNTLNAETASATVNPQKNEEVKQKLKLVRAQLEHLEQTTTRRREQDARMAKVLPKRFKKMLIKQIVQQMVVPLGSVCGAPGTNNIGITIEGVPEVVFRALFPDNVGNKKGAPPPSESTKKRRKYLTEAELSNVFNKTFRMERNVLLPRPRRFLLELITSEDDGNVAMVVSYNSDTLTLKLIGAYSIKEAVGMGLGALGKNIRLG